MPDRFEKFSMIFYNFHKFYKSIYIRLIEQFQRTYSVVINADDLVNDADRNDNFAKLSITKRIKRIK